MKKIYSFFILSIISLGLCAQTPFSGVEKKGFNTQPFARNGSVLDMKAFKGNLYAAMGTDSGYVFRSSTGDPGSFQKVFDVYGVNRSQYFTVSNDAGGYMFMATTAQTFSTTTIKRTADGTTWDDFFNSPSGLYNVNAFKSAGGVEDSIYACYYGITGGIMIVKNAITSNDPSNSLNSWDTLADMNIQFGSFAYPTASIVFNDSLYYAFSDNTLFQTGNGQALHANANFITSMGSASGLGNTKCTAMEVYNGELYFGTENNISGFELWKTSDGISYVNVVDSLFNSLSIVANMKSAGGKLWILAKNSGDDFSIYSWDGATLTLEVSDEFGAANIDANYNSAMETFNNHLYVGVTHFKMPALRIVEGGGNGTLATSWTTGGQIWRACMIGAPPTVDITNTNPDYACQGNSVVLNSSGDALSYIWNTGATGSSISVTDTGEYALTGVAANGCRYADFGRVTNYEMSMPPIFTIGMDNMMLSGIGLCQGDTSSVITARDPENEFNCVVLQGTNPGFKTIANPVFSGDLDLTIEFWMKPDGSGTVVSEYDTLSSTSWSNNNYGLVRLSGGSVYINIPGNSSSDLYIGNANFGQWNHIVLRYDAGLGLLDGFVNGVVSSSELRSREIPEDFGGYDAYKFGIESLMPYYEQNFTGRLRDIRIWSSARTVGEIQSNMYGLPIGTYPDLVYYYKTQETSGTLLNDSSGNNYNAQIIGSGYFGVPRAITWYVDPGLSLLGNGAATVHPNANAVFNTEYVDNNGCTSYQGSLYVDVYYIDITSSSFASCGGNSVNLSIGTNSPLNNPTWQSTTLGTIPTFSVSVAPPSPEWVYLTDSIAGGSCVIKDSVMINVGPAFVSGVGNPPPINACEGTEVTLDMDISGGTLPYTVYWNYPQMGNADTTLIDTLVYTIPPFYSEVNVMAMDAIGCQINATFNSTHIPSTDLRGHISTPALANVDNGFVYVFKHQPGTAGFDTIGYTFLDFNGDYLFSPLTAGNYLVKVLPDETSFPLAVPTYYGNAFQWDSSLVYTHGCLQNDTADIVVVESTANITGPGSISGYIVEGDAFGSGRLLGPGTQPNIPFVPGGPLKGVDVKLGKNPGGGIQARTMSDSTGFYVFDSLPIGGYKIYVDIPNLPMDSTREISIAGADSSIQNNYFADSASVYVNPDTISSVGIYSSAKQYENNFSIYPNPAKGAMYVSYELKESSTVGFEIMNTMGQLMKSEPMRKYPEGKNIFIFNTEQLNLQGGVYFISIISNNKKYTQRIVVID